MIVLKEMDCHVLDEKLANFKKISEAYWKAQNELSQAVNEAKKEYYSNDNGLYGYFRDIKETITQDNGVTIQRNEYHVDAEMNVNAGTLKAYGNLYDSENCTQTVFKLYGNNDRTYDNNYSKKYIKERELLSAAIDQYRIYDPFKQYENIR